MACMMTAFIVTETQITLAHSCADLLPQTHSMFSHQGQRAVRGSGSPMGPKRMGWGCCCGWCLENWWSPGALLPTQTGLCICSISLLRLSPAMISSPNDLLHLVLIVMISGLGMPWTSQSNISSFILFYQVVIGFHQTVCFWNKQITSKPTAVSVLSLAIKLWFAQLSGAKWKWKGKAVHALHRRIHRNLGNGSLAQLFLFLFCLVVGSLLH